MNITSWINPFKKWFQMDAQTKSPKVIVIGAGASGIAAASRLVENDIDDVIVLEAENRIGGRINSTNFDGCIVDLGAQWCHGQKNNAVYNLVEKLDLLQSSVNSWDDYIYYDSDSNILDKQITDELLKISSKIREDTEAMEEFNGSFGDYFIKRYNEDIQILYSNDKKRLKIANEFLEWIHKLFICLDAAESWFDVSAKQLNCYQECDGDYYLHWKDKGYKTLLDVLMKKLSKSRNESLLEDKILSNKEVCKILWHDNESNNFKITVMCTDGSEYKADHVIVTVSLGVLKKNHLKLFKPVLPMDKQNAIACLGFGTVNKIMLKFSRQWWSDKCKGFSFLWSEDDDNAISLLSQQLSCDMSWMKGVFGFYPVDSFPVLLAFIVGQPAVAIESLPLNIVSEGCNWMLKKFIANAGEPVDIICSSWNSNPNFCGSYSYRSVNGDKLTMATRDLQNPILTKRTPSLLFAGEATHSHYYSTVHGALESGWREADRILDFYNRTALYSKVVIVGAGMAGLGAAQVFVNSGFTDFLILEAQDQPGGRIKSVQLNNEVIELGAQWIHGTENSLYALAKKHNLISSEISNEGLGMYIRNDGYVFEDFLVKRVDFEIGKILEQCEEFVYFSDYPNSVGEFLEEKFLEYIKCNDNTEEMKDMKLELFDWHVKFQVIDNSCFNLNELSAKDWGKYLCFGNQKQKHINLKNGYKSLIDVLNANLPEGVLKCNFPVLKINWDNSHDKIKIHSDNDVTVFCDHVIVTCSLGFLKQYSSTLFEPNLSSDVINTIDTMGFYGIGKIFLVFDYKWWHTEGFQLIWRRDTVLTGVDKWTRYISGFDLVFNQPNVLLGWVGSEGVSVMESLSEEQVGVHCIQLLRRFLKNDGIPFPKQVIRSKWVSCPWIRGGYSYSTPQCDVLEIGPSTLCEPISRNGIPRIFMAGEACHSNHFSTTHGAFESGQKQSKFLLSLIK